MNPLYLIAEIHPLPEKLNDARTAFEALISESKKEPGCLLYDLVIESSVETGSETWIMMEKWASRDAWEQHMETPHVKHMNRISPAFSFAATVLRFLNPVALTEKSH
jgi:quinol monooxygenase YgiN